MELFTILLSSLLGILSPAGFVIDRVAEDAIRSRLNSVETLAVRVDNAPNYQVIQGKVDRVRIAGRGLYPEANIRIEALEVETDDIAVDLAQLRQGEIKLEQPLDAGVRLVLTQADLNQALQSPQITEQLRNLSLDFLGSPAQQLERYEFVEPQIQFLDNRRLQFQVTLQSQEAQESQESQESQQSQESKTQIPISIETEIQILNGRQLQLIEPAVTIDGKPLPPQLVNLLVGGISQRFDLTNLESRGITARVLNWQISNGAIELAAFIRIDPQFTEQIDD